MNFVPENKFCSKINNIGCFIRLTVTASKPGALAVTVRCILVLRSKLKILETKIFSRIFGNQLIVSRSNETHISFIAAI